MNDDKIDFIKAFDDYYDFIYDRVRENRIKYLI